MANDTDKVSGVQLYVQKDKISGAFRVAKDYGYVGIN
jgi:hypothetical protein